MSGRNVTAKSLTGAEQKVIEAEENLVIDTQFLIQETLNDRGMTRADLARLTGISKARLTQVMKPDANPTLRTLARLFEALDDQLIVSRKNKKVACGRTLAAPGHWVSEAISTHHDRSRDQRHRSEGLYQIVERRAIRTELVRPGNQNHEKHRSDVDLAVA